MLMNGNTRRLEGIIASVKCRKAIIKVKSTYGKEYKLNIQIARDIVLKRGQVVNIYRTQHGGQLPRRGRDRGYEVFIPNYETYEQKYLGHISASQVGG